MENKSKFHVGLHVSNIEKTTQFYNTLFNAEPVKSEQDYVKFELDDPGLVISFIKSSESNHTNFGHLGIRVSSFEEVMERKEELESLLNIDLVEKNTDCCYARQNKFWVSDPDGYRWEVYHFIKDTTPENTEKEVVNCC